MADLLSKLSFISVSTDFWSHINGTSYLVLTGHYITNQLDLKSTILRFSTFEQRHFSDLIGIEIEKQLIELKIFNKVVSVICDAAPNMVKMFDHLTRSDINRIRCQAHLLHVIVCNGLGLWIDRKKKKHTTAELNSTDPDERLSHSLKKNNIVGVEESIIDEVVTENNTENSESQSKIDENDVNIFSFIHESIVYLHFFFRTKNKIVLLINIMVNQILQIMMIQPRLIVNLMVMKNMKIIFKWESSQFSMKTFLYQNLNHTHRTYIYRRE